MRFQPIQGVTLAFFLCFAAFNVQAATFGENPNQNFNTSRAFEGPQILPVDQAFDLTVLREAGQLVLLWQIQPGYYLYRHKVQVNGSKRLGVPQLPSGIEKTDEYFGDVEVYYESLEVNVPTTGQEREEFLVEYQGCADIGICYPPQKKTISR